jgi:hypothetical protein
VGAFELVVHFRVLELCDVEGRGVLHESHRHFVAKVLAEKALGEVGGPRDDLGRRGNRQLDRDQRPQVRPVRRLPTPLVELHRLDDELSNPQHRDRRQGSK